MVISKSPFSLALFSPAGSCAFRNTPKFTAVRGRGKIVRGEWLAACTKQKRRLPWRRFSTDPADGKQPDSGDEVWAEELRPQPPPGSSEYRQDGAGYS